MIKFEDKNQRLKSTTKYLISIFSLALLIGLLMAIFFPCPESEFEDQAEYNNIAWNILQGHGYSINKVEPYDPTARRGPTYPFFLAAIYLFFGQNYTAVYIIQAILYAFTCLIIYLLGREAFDNKRIGLIAALGAALYPAFWVFIRQLMTEPLFAFLLAMILLLWIRAIKEKSARWYPLLGVLIAIGALCRTTLAAFPLFILLGLLLLYQDKKRAIIDGGVVLLITFLVIAPWTARNYFVLHRFIPITSDMGRALVAAIIPYENRKQQEAVRKEIMPKLEKMMSEEKKSFDEAAQALARSEFKKDPWKYFKFLPQKLFLFWRPYSYSEMFGVKAPSWEYMENKSYGPLFLKFALLTLNTLPLLLGMVGLFFIRDKWRTALPLLLIIVYFTLVHTMVHAGTGTRYHVPIMSAVFVLASLGIVKVIGLVKPGDR
ncbi:MAG: glycosyltransferase family 39 protein [bacterium]